MLGGRILEKTEIPGIETIPGIHLAAGEGFEPSHTESESAVLPLHKPAILFAVFRSEQILLYKNQAICQYLFSNSFLKFSRAWKTVV